MKGLKSEIVIAIEYMYMTGRRCFLARLFCSLFLKVLVGGVAGHNFIGSGEANAAGKGAQDGQAAAKCLSR